jgi:hypothetical protein
MAKWTMALDARGKDVSQSTFGTDGKPSAGLAVVKVTTDERGDVVGVTWLAADGSAFVSPDGSSGWRQTLDARGNIVRSYPVGSKGERVALKDGTSGWRADYDIYDNRIRAVTLDINDKPINGKDGEATWEGDYDLYGNEIAHRSFDQDGKPINDPWNTYAYDAKGRVIRRQMVDANSTPMLSPESKRSIVHYAYDDKGRIVEEASFGLKDEPLNRGDLGWHRITSAYAADGAVTHKCFAVSGAPVTPCRSD